MLKNDIYKQMKKQLFSLIALCLLFTGCQTPPTQKAGVLPGTGDPTKQYYFITGEIKKPGEYLLEENDKIDAFQAIMRAGGLVKLRAEENKTVIVRANGQEKRQVIEVKEIIEKGDVSTNQYLQPGDIIYSPPNLFAVISDVVTLILSPIKGLIELSTLSLAASG